MKTVFGRTIAHHATLGTFAC